MKQTVLNIRWRTTFLYLLTLFFLTSYGTSSNNYTTSIDVGNGNELFYLSFWILFDRRGRNQEKVNKANSLKFL